MLFREDSSTDAVPAPRISVCSERNTRHEREYVQVKKSHQETAKHTRTLFVPLCLLLLAGPVYSQLSPREFGKDQLYTAPSFGDLRLNPKVAGNRQTGSAGGFVAKAKRKADDSGWEEVQYSYSCGRGTYTIETLSAEPRSGQVAALIDCGGAGGMGTQTAPVRDLDLRIHNIEDGGWYWMFKPLGNDVAAASASLIRMDLLEKAPKLLPYAELGQDFTVEIHNVDATHLDGRVSGGATVFTDETNRLFDIFPHPTPVLPMQPCFGAIGSDEGRNADCAVGRSADWQLVLTDSSEAPLDGPLVRPASGEAATVSATLSITTGHLTAPDCEITVAPTLSGGRQGQVDLAIPAGVTAGTVTPPDCSTAELAFSWTVQVANDATRCATDSGDRGTPQTVRVAVTPSGGAVAPALPGSLYAEFQVTCASAASSALEAVDLVPENPFPPSE